MSTVAPLTSTYRNVSLSYLLCLRRFRCLLVNSWTPNSLAVRWSLYLNKPIAQSVERWNRTDILTITAYFTVLSVGATNRASQLLIYFPKKKNLCELLDRFVL